MAPRTNPAKRNVSTNNTTTKPAGATLAENLADATNTVVEPTVTVNPSQAPIHGKLIMNLYNGDYRLSAFQDSTMNTFVIYHKDEVVGAVRGHRRAAITTFGLHISVITRLAINVSEEAASEYLAAAAFFDNNLRAYTAKQPHYVDLQYTHVNPNGKHTGYMFIAGKNVAFDDTISDDAKEILFRAMPYIKNFCDRYENIEREHDTLLVGNNLSGDLSWK